MLFLLSAGARAIIQEDEGHDVQGLRGRPQSKAPARGRSGQALRSYI